MSVARSRLAADTHSRLRDRSNAPDTRHGGRADSEARVTGGRCRGGDNPADVARDEDKGGEPNDGDSEDRCKEPVGPRPRNL
jgi:hypothetical protein